jgi:hypothetical protein
MVIFANQHSSMCIISKIKINNCRGNSKPVINNIDMLLTYLSVSSVQLHKLFFTCIGYFKRWVNFNKTLCADIIIHVFRYLSNMNKTGITTVGKNISCPSPFMLLTYLSVSSVQLRHVDNLV